MSKRRNDAPEHPYHLLLGQHRTGVTDITKPDPIAGGLLEHIERRKGLRGDYAHEWLTTRKPTEDEAKLLDIDAGEPVLSLVIAVHQASGEPILASVAILPGSRHEIEDTYPLR